ncbi:MAG: hypothetical protein Q4P14_01295 [Methanobacteriaceae archaeon]|nr:hypothetical protein [Methanobacteriaceae archaeon]
MIGSSFLFLKEKFPLIYFDSVRMEKNLVDGDGIESIMLAGRICERITKTIFEIEGFPYVESQFKRIQKLDNFDILPKDIKDKFNQIRLLRNDVYHRDVANALNKSTYTRTYSSKSSNSSNSATKSYSSSSSTRTYESNSSKVAKSIGELSSAKQAHKMVFNLAVWFFEEYGEDKSFTRPFYKIGKRSKDIDILIRLKQAVLDEEDFREVLVATKDNAIVELLKELRGLDEIKKESKDPNLVYKSNDKIKIRKPDKPYSECLGISYDDDLFMWRASYGDKELGLFSTSKEAYESREVFLHSIPVPKLNSNGKYSNHIGISFSKINKMWTVSAKGQIVGYCTSEKDAILMRDSYYKNHGLIIKYKNNDKNNQFNKKDNSNKFKNTGKDISSSNNNRKSSKSSKNIKSEKLSYGSKYKKEKPKVKVQDGKRVSKLSKAKKDVKVNRKASKYEGVYYEEGLFMWSAEVDGKELGLFASEDEAKQKRDEYLKLRNN